MNRLKRIQYILDQHLRAPAIQARPVRTRTMLLRARRFTLDVTVSTWVVAVLIERQTVDEQQPAQSRLLVGYLNWASIRSSSLR